MGIKIQNGEPPDPATTDDFLKLIEANRARLRSLGSMLLSVCGMFLSSVFVILFFILKEHVKVPLSVPRCLFATVGFLLAAIVLNVLSALPPPATVAMTKLEVFDVLSRIYTREYRKMVAAVIALFVALLTITVALAMIALATVAV